MFCAFSYFLLKVNTCKLIANIPNTYPVSFSCFAPDNVYLYGMTNLHRQIHRKSINGEKGKKWDAKEAYRADAVMSLIVVISPIAMRLLAAALFITPATAPADACLLTPERYPVVLPGNIVGG